MRPHKTSAMELRGGIIGYIRNWIENATHCGRTDSVMTREELIARLEETARLDAERTTGYAPLTAKQRARIDRVKQAAAAPAPQHGYPVHVEWPWQAYMGVTTLAFNCAAITAQTNRKR